MLPPDTTRTLATRLYDARKSRTQLRHFSSEHPGMTVEDGYAIQREWVKLEIADGRAIRGRKIGLTSRAMQQSSQITERLTGVHVRSSSNRSPTYSWTCFQTAGWS